MVGQGSETVEHGSGMASFAVQSSKTAFKHVTSKFGNADTLAARAEKFWSWRGSPKKRGFCILEFAFLKIFIVNILFFKKQNNSR